MAAQYEKAERPDTPASVDEDAAALAALARSVRLGRPVEPHDLPTLLERAALGDRATEERLVAANLPMVIRLAAAHKDLGLSAGDLVQEGSIGLVEAVRSFAASGEADFGTYAERRVGAQIEAAIAIESASVRDAQLLVAAATDYERTEILMRYELQREPSEVELAEKLEWTVDRTRYVAQVVIDAKRRHDEELLAFIDPEAIALDDDEDERAEFEG
ncbi:MAG TPA: sigma factor [Candidatus Acidoferrum sp.]|jgi:RNA polymerase sigma factor (sigma-70 family)|nr:sigma factor [Candidatus Acidoferrum sp.]